jgi:hypothetical protein
LAVSATLQTTAFAWARSIRSTSSLGPTAVVVGTITAPRRMIASMDSHSSTWLPSMSRTLSPRVTPCAASRRATWRDRSTISANV